MDGAVDDGPVNILIHGRNRERLLGSTGAVANKASDNDPGATMYTGGCTSKARRLVGLLRVLPGQASSCMAVAAAGASPHRTSARVHTGLDTVTRHHVRVGHVQPWAP
jgi:hypothetical protein